MDEPLRLVVRPEDADVAPAGVGPFEDFFRREKEGLYGALCLVTRNRHEAEELTQDAFVRVLEQWDGWGRWRTRGDTCIARR